jgi:predicted transposase/invertase (TIGR01784 family)
VARLDPKLDIVFKLLLLRERELLLDMVQCVLARPVEEITVLDRDIHGELVRDKKVVFDVRVALHDGSRVDLEMQVRAGPALASRLFYYGARDFADQLRCGDDYHLLTTTTVITWLVEPLFPGDALHFRFRMYDPDTCTSFGDQLAIHVLQLSSPSSLSPPAATGYDAQVQRWARFLTARDDAELDQLASEDPIMTLAKQTLDKLSEDPEVRRLARDREDAIKLYEIDLAARCAEAEAKGEARVVLKLLGLRFGPPSAATRTCVEAATLEQLDAWAERVLTAQTLDEVLAP